MNKSESIAELAAALAKAQGAMSPAKMDSTNPFLKNKYADLGSVIQAARKPLADNGLSFTQSPAVTDGTVTVTTLLMHASGQWIESAITLPLDGGKGLSLAQSMGAIITYLRRYSLSAILGIYADEDNDGNQPAKPAAQKAPQAAPEAPQRTPAAQVVDNAPAGQKAWSAQNVTLDEAQTAAGSDNQLYWGLDSSLLAPRLKGIDMALAKPETTDDRRAELEHKKEIILAILKYRNVI